MEYMSEQDPRVVVIGPDGSPLNAAQEQAAGEADVERNPITEMVSQPDKVMRIGTMIKQLLEEVRAAPLDERSRSRLRDIHASSIRELADGLAPELRDELARISLPLSAKPRSRATPSCASRKRSWSAGSRGCSTACRPR